MIFDLHCDTILRVFKDDSALKKNEYHIDIEKMIKGSSTGQFFAMFVEMDSNPDAYKTCNEMIDRYEVELSLNPEIVATTTYEEIQKNRENNKISAILTIEEGGVLQGSLEKLQHFYNRGCRSITLTWNYENEIGYPNCLAPESGLKPFGIEVVKKMNALGMLIDVSHLSDAGFWDCIKYSSSPIIASHSNSRTICEQSRNLTDEMIIALNENGGVMGMNFCSFFLDSSKVSKINDIVKHINHIKSLVGIDVIAMGTDFDGIGGELEISDMSKVSLLKDALLNEGYTKEEIDKIFYLNAERVMKSVFI